MDGAAGIETLSARGLTRLFAHRPFSFTLRMAPMIDIIFLLLIFFLVCAKWRPQEQFLPLQLSTAGAAEMPLVRPEPLIIHITSDEQGCDVRVGQLTVVRIRQNEAEQDLLALVEQLQAALRVQHRFASDPVEIVCEPDVKWDYFAKIYNVLYGVGLTDITFSLTESP
jgi:biopolymer transport protein ExbD